jgi:hypothetical protein
MMAGMNPRNLIVSAGAFFAFFGGYLFIKGQAVTTAQLVFRLGLISIGALLLVIGAVLRALEINRE